MVLIINSHMVYQPAESITCVTPEVAIFPFLLITWHMVKLIKEGCYYLLSSWNYLFVQESCQSLNVRLFCK